MDESLRGLHKHLLPGGALLIEIEMPRDAERSAQPEASEPPERRWKRADGAEIVLRGTGSYDPETRVEIGGGSYGLFVSGKRVRVENNDWACRFWEAEEFAARLSAAGFVDVKAAKAFSDEAVDGSERVASFVARRPA